MKGLLSKVKDVFSKKKTQVGEDYTLTTKSAIKTWEGEVGTWHYTELRTKRIENCPYKSGAYEGFDIVFGALTGKLEIEIEGDEIIFKEWTREYDGRAPYYFKDREDFQTQLRSNTGTLTGFYLPF